MTKYVLITSYAHAESLGIKPVDSIISVSGAGCVIEFKKTPPYKVVGYVQGYTFHQGEVIFDYNRKEYLAHSDELEEGFNIKRFEFFYDGVLRGDWELLSKYVPELVKVVPKVGERLERVVKRLVS